MGAEVSQQQASASQIVTACDKKDKTRISTDMTERILHRSQFESQMKTHFSDYSLFPDRFSAEIRQTKSLEPLVGLPIPEGLAIANEQQPKLPPSLPIPTVTVSKYRLGVRRGSSIEEEQASLPNRFFDYTLLPEKEPRQRLNSCGSEAPVTPETGTTPVDSIDEDRRKKTRQRKTSAPPRFCFFDYSMIPDKDPKSWGKPSGNALNVKD